MVREEIHPEPSQLRHDAEERPVTPMVVAAEAGEGVAVAEGDDLRHVFARADKAVQASVDKIVDRAAKFHSARVGN